MTKDFAVFDADSQVVEPPALWKKYLGHALRRQEGRTVAYLKINGEIFRDKGHPNLPRHALWRPGMTWDAIGELDPHIRHKMTDGASGPQARLASPTWTRWGWTSRSYTRPGSPKGSFCARSGRGLCAGPRLQRLDRWGARCVVELLKDPLRAAIGHVIDQHPIGSPRVGRPQYEEIGLVFDKTTRVARCLVEVDDRPVLQCRRVELTLGPHPGCADRSRPPQKAGPRQRARLHSLGFRYWPSTAPGDVAWGSSGWRYCPAGCSDQRVLSAETHAGLRYDGCTTLGGRPRGAGPVAQADIARRRPWAAQHRGRADLAAHRGARAARLPRHRQAGGATTTCSAFRLTISARPT